MMEQNRIDENNEKHIAVLDELSQLQSFSPYVLEASLSSCNWDDLFGEFYRANCPRFAGFRSLCEGSREFDLHMQIVHNDFLTSIDALLRHMLDDMGVSEAQCAAATEKRLRSGDRVAYSLFQRLQRYADFFEFGAMMEHQYDVRVAAVPSPSFPSTTAANSGHVRVLWDVENVSATCRSSNGSTLSGFESVQRLQTFLSGLGLYGPGVNSRITAFFSPGNSRVSQKTAQQLDKAGVEMVWVSGKREDADRKLGHRIYQEMQVLPAAQSSCFVLISSDTDFRHHLSLLHSSGYRVIVMHRANTKQWEEVMSLYATESYHWNTVMKIEDDGANTNIDRCVEESAREEDAGAEKRKRRKQRKKKEKQGTTENIIALNDINLTGDKWYVGKCSRWLHRFGFVSVNSNDASDKVQTMSVFVHASILPLECGGSLIPGTDVSVLLGRNERGPCITALKLATAAYCTQKEDVK